MIGIQNLARHAAICSFAVATLAACVTPAQSERTPSASNAPVAGAGPYPSVMEVDPGLPTHTVYRPRDLGHAGRLPIIAFGNGGCLAMGNMYAPYLHQVASHGYLAIAIGPPGDPAFMRNLAHLPGSQRPGPGAAPAAPPAAPAAGAPRLPSGITLPPGVHMSQASALTDAINWALAENSRRGSQYYHRLATDQIAVMGQSCGGVQAMAVNGDPRVKTTVMLDSGLFPAGGMGAAMGADVTALGHVHSPVLFLIGGPTDIAYPQAVANFPVLNVPVFMGNMNVGHGGTFGDPNGGKFADATVAWLDWQLKGDARASRMFKGADCGLCRDPDWQVQSRNIN